MATELERQLRASIRAVRARKKAGVAAKKKAAKKAPAKRKSALARTVKGKQAGKAARPGADPGRGGRTFKVKGRAAKLTTGGRPGGARKLRGGGRVVAGKFQKGRSGGIATRGQTVARRAGRASGKSSGGG